MLDFFYRTLVILNKHVILVAFKKIEKFIITAKILTLKKNYLYIHNQHHQIKQ